MQPLALRNSEFIEAMCSFDCTMTMAYGSPVKKPYYRYKGWLSFFNLARGL